MDDCTEEIARLETENAQLREELAGWRSGSARQDLLSQLEDLKAAVRNYWRNPSRYHSQKMLFLAGDKTVADPDAKEDTTYGVRTTLRHLSDQERAEVFAEYCRCGKPDPSCNCQKGE